MVYCIVCDDRTFPTGRCPECGRLMPEQLFDPLADIVFQMILSIGRCEADARALVRQEGK